MLILHDKALERDLDRISAQTGESQSEIVDRLVREFFAGHKWLTKPRTRRSSTTSIPKPPMFGSRF